LGKKLGLLEEGVLRGKKPGLLDEGVSRKVEARSLGNLFGGVSED
jgi:hypothetical protein